LRFTGPIFPRDNASNEAEKLRAGALIPLARVKAGELLNRVAQFNKLRSVKQNNASSIFRAGDGDLIRVNVILPNIVIVDIVLAKPAGVEEVVVIEQEDVVVGTFLLLPHDDACPAGWGEPYVVGGDDVIPGTCGGATPQMAYRDGVLDRSATEFTLWDATLNGGKNIYGPDGVVGYYSAWVGDEMTGASHPQFQSPLGYADPEGTVHYGDIGPYELGSSYAIPTVLHGINNQDAPHQVWMQMARDYAVYPAYYIYIVNISGSGGANMPVAGSDTTHPPLQWFVQNSTGMKFAALTSGGSLSDDPYIHEITLTYSGGTWGASAAETGPFGVDSTSGGTTVLNDSRAVAVQTIPSPYAAGHGVAYYAEIDSVLVTGYGGKIVPFDNDGYSVSFDIGIGYLGLDEPYTTLAELYEAEGVSRLSQLEAIDPGFVAECNAISGYNVLAYDDAYLSASDYFAGTGISATDYVWFNGVTGNYKMLVVKYSGVGSVHHDDPPFDRSGYYLSRTETTSLSDVYQTQQGGQLIFGGVGYDAQDQLVAAHRVENTYTESYALIDWDGTNTKPDNTLTYNDWGVYVGDQKIIDLEQYYTAARSLPFLCGDPGEGRATVLSINPPVFFFVQYHDIRQAETDQTHTHVQARIITAGSEIMLVDSYHDNTAAIAGTEPFPSTYYADGVYLDKNTTVARDRDGNMLISFPLIDPEASHEADDYVTKWWFFVLDAAGKLAMSRDKIVADIGISGSGTAIHPVRSLPKEVVAV
jgi:hypothetical protein